MKLKIFFLGGACALVLASCGGGTSGGTQVKNPTVEEMAQLEKQWGVKSHAPAGQPLQLGRPSANTDQYELPHAPRGPSIQVPPPEPAPLPPAASPSPTAESIPGVTPAQIQKLKN